MNTKCLKNKKFGMGWLRDYPDFRDFTINRDKVSQKLKRLGQTSIKEMFKKIGILNISNIEDTTLPDKVDLTQWCSPIEDQESIGSCTAHAGVGIVEYFEKRSFNTHIDASRLFLYKTARNLLELTGDTGAYLRSTMAALALFGVPPEKYWPYIIEDYDKEPTAFCYCFAQNYQAIQYVRLDPYGIIGQDLLNTIKTNLAVGIPSMFGFTVYNSIDQASNIDNKGKIPYPSPTDYVIGGHGIGAIGYDNNIVITNAQATTNEDIQTTGAILIRNSWGTEWGDSGYGWLPYDYILNGLAVDWWTLLKSEWIDSGEFEL